MRTLIIMSMRITVVLFLLLALISCKKSSTESTQNKPPVIASLTATPVSPTWGASCLLVVIAADPEGKALTYSWTSSDGLFTTPLANDSVTWQAPKSSGDFICGVTVSDGENTVSREITITVTKPPYDFFDDFSQGEGKWTFGGCTHSISNQELTMVSTGTSQAYTYSSNFSNYLDIPWVYKGDMTIVSSSSSSTDNGIALGINDAGTFAVTDMWLSVRNNSTTANWIWLWWVPTLSNQWLPWDATCYGTSSNVYTSNQKNALEMSVASDKKFTLKANNYTLSSGNSAIPDMQTMLSRSIDLKVTYLALRGGSGTTTRWDNIIFDSETSQLPKIQKINRPLPPSDAEVNKILNRIAQGEDVTLKSKLREKLDK